MKAPAVARTQHQRKEALRKETTEMHHARRTSDKHDQEEPAIWRAVIYMRELRPKHGINKLSVARQGDLCRLKAKRIRAEVVGEFVDIRELRFVRPGLHYALELAREEEADYLIFTSLDVLADCDADRFEVGWYLGQAGTIPMEVMTEDD